MSSRKNHKGKSKKTSGEYCGGFVDQHGQWNNGFYCPKWGGPDRQYCCGPDDDKYCCPKEETQEKLHGNQTQQISLLIGLAIGSLVLLVATIVLSCYFCRCCWAYKRRKRSQATPQLPAYPGLSRDSSDPVNYAMCPHGTIFPEFMIPVPQYPAEAPPPYQVDEPGVPLEVKQPLPLSEVQVEPSPQLRQETNIDGPYVNEPVTVDTAGRPAQDSSSHQSERTNVASNSPAPCNHRPSAAVIPHSGSVLHGTCHRGHDVSPRSSPNVMPSTSHHSQYQIPKFKSSHGRHGNHGHHHGHHRHHHRAHHYAGYDSRSLSSTDSDSYTG